MDFFSVHKAWLHCRRRKRATPRAQCYEAYLLDNLVETAQELASGNWRPRRPVCFLVNKPKIREIHAAHYRDRVVHHLLVPKLERLYEPVFIHDLHSNRAGKGIHTAVQRLRHFMRSVLRTQGRAYFLQMDIRNFFNSIDRRILFSLLQHRLRKAVRQGKITEQEAVFCRDISHIILRQDVGGEAYMAAAAEEIARVPPHKRLINAGRDKGLPIGNLTSQFFANVYLNELDQFVKHELKCRHYLRYVDDFMLLHDDPAQLGRWQEQIVRFLAERLLLELKQPSILRPVQSGANFLGYIVRPNYLLVRRRVVGNLRERLVRFQQQWIESEKGRVDRGELTGSVCRQGIGRMTCFEQQWITENDQQGWTLRLLPEPRDQLRSVLASYFGHFQHACHYRLVQRIFTRFPWLSCLFDLRGDRLLPLWQPVHVSSYKSQQRFFRRTFPNARIDIQCGCSFDRLPAPAVLQQQPGNIRYSVRQVTVRQQGYLKHGLRRRAVEELTINSGEGKVES
jgi:RNA-directed DNA polymerase